MIILIWTGVIILAIGIIGMFIWWLADRAAGAEFKAMDRAWLATGSNVITAVRAELYERVGLRPMMSSTPGTGSADARPASRHREQVHLPPA
jgi:hypothetical protein